MIIVGLTGGIATGKSTASQVFSQSRDVFIIDADKVAREVVSVGEPAYNKVIKHFGPTVPDLLLEDGSLNRPALGKAVFGDSDQLRVLNSIVHPAVRKRTLYLLFQAWIRFYKVVILDVPLLFEAGTEVLCDKTLVIACSAENQRTRLLARNPELSEEDADKRIKSQLPIDVKVSYADMVIWNDGSLDDLKHNVLEVLRTITPGLIANILQFIPPIALARFLYNYFSRSKARRKRQQQKSK
ncbi:hypothetical protein CANCADRAFT_1580 [Tortispora caseinolytica NRRL Y-17796]|uniref:Dephospho-CoA kinase n=1 Tax=Tortispora caseinolytica NRRL Y-17796 TaxID=767744 RepID=A0A1E4TDK6_9ASCO|nr:hypothetical protein CANCADRAFT_1580 [Tortispora caseinolytica NRRL Y-17796]